MISSTTTKVLVAICVFVFSVRVYAQIQLLESLSATSLKLTIRHDDVEIGTGTGFVLQKGQHYYLITNRHIVLACSQSRDPNDVGNWLCANNVVILHNRLNHVGEWISVDENLYGDHKAKLWREHPQLGATPGSSVDLVALPLTKTTDVAFIPLDLTLRNADVRIVPGDSVSVVGFPFGLAQAAGLAIWKTGTIASDIIVNYEGKAKFLLDTTSRPGMSGSPVYVRKSGGYQTEEGGTTIGGGVTKFLGVFAEENPAAEIGVVWKAEIVQSLYDSLP